MNAFRRLWAGQLVSILGSGLTSFGLGVWVYQRTGSVTQFAMIAVFAALPGLIAAGMAGPLVDRWNRSKVIIMSDLLAGMATLLVLPLMLMNVLSLRWVCVIASILSICTSFRWPAYSAAISVIVPENLRGRANGMVQLSDAVAQILPPITAGFLIGSIGVPGLVVIDFSTYLFSSFITMTVISKTPAAANNQRLTSKSFFDQALYGWRYIRSRRKLLVLMAYLGVLNFFFGLVAVLATPMILSFTSARTLGTILSFGGVGMVGGAFLMSMWGGFKQQMDTILLFGLLAGIGVGVVGVRPSAVLIASGWFLFLLSVPIINAASQAIWQSEVQAEVQGRVFSIRRMLTTFSQPLAFIVAGPLAQRIFEPFLENSGRFSRAAQSLVGHGHGRGIGLMMVLVGVLTLCFSIFATWQFGTRSQQPFPIVTVG